MWLLFSKHVVKSYSNLIPNPKPNLPRPRPDLALRSGIQMVITREQMRPCYRLNRAQFNITAMNLKR